MKCFRQAAHGGLRAALCGLLLLSDFAGAQAPAADPQLMKVRMKAAAPGEGVESRVAAVRAAQQEIIRQTLRAALNLDDLGALGVLINEPAPYIKSTQLIRSDTSKEDGTSVEVECYVNRKQLLKDAASVLLPRMLHPPVVLVLVAEQLSSAAGMDTSKPGAAESALARAFEEAKLDVADAAVVRAMFAHPDLLAKIKEGNSAAAELGSLTGAQTVVLGEAIVTGGEEAQSGNVLTMRAGVTLRVYRGMDGSLLDSISQEAEVQGYNPVAGAVSALDDACAKLSQDAALYAVLASVEPERGDELIVTVEGGNRSQLDQLVQSAQAAGGSQIQEIFQGSVMARYRIKYEGRTGDFVDQLTERRYEGFTVEPRRVIQRDIVLKIVS